ncbi:transposase IS116IS110IS902 family protein [Roseomonas sp. TAS13]|jgi:transposase|uniref:IS110 family transposase n=1 Tax=Roseomonas sp. TAS13 TaxID=1926319 RepID=UPI0009683D72|nr:IS110 family transposase [Roseomonas sp. TAS13]USQ74326.1 IS110 family transposase [Roseomonas mucosa]GAV36029.1 transposase IS116IS110IS902 family protein [Roseomonas sp. TAS13]
MRIVGMDIHRVFAEAVMLDGERVIRLGRIGMTRDHLGKFARTLTHDDHVVIEATGNATAVAEVMAPHVGRVVIANPKQVRMIAHAKIKTDAIDATVLARLYASGFLPEVWVPDAHTAALRREVTRREQIVRQRTRLKTTTHSILHAHLLPQCPHIDLFGNRGRAWLMAQPLPSDEREAVERHLREYDRLGEDLRVVERELARAALDQPEARRLMTVPGIDMVVALGLLAAIGKIERFKGPDQLVAYIGLNPSVRQSGEGPAYHGRITKHGRSQARTMLVEAAWVASRSPGPLRAFVERVARRRGKPIAAVAVARKLAVIVWHMLSKGEDYGGVRPALHARKLRDLELRAGQPSQRGRRGNAHAYNLERVRVEERRRVEQAETAYRRLTEGWTKRGRRVPTGAAEEERLS